MKDHIVGKRQLGAYAFKVDCFLAINRGGTAGYKLVPGHFARRRVFLCSGLKEKINGGF